jgi:hypothetical protein
MALLSTAFGSSYFLAAPFINFSVESTPAGRCNLLVFNQSEHDYDKWEPWSRFVLSHSLGYSDPRAIEAVRQWIEDVANGGSQETRSK